LVEGNLSTGNNQSYDPGEGIRIFKGINADVAMVQEMNYGSDSTTAIRSFVDQAFGTTYSYFRESTSGPGTIPNGIVSRYEILDQGEWVDASVSNRKFAWVRLDIPGDVDLFAVSVHLLTSNDAARNVEANALVNLFMANVPAGDFIVLGGDFNTTNRLETCVTTFAQVFDDAAPYPVDNLGDENTNGPRSRPHDWLIVDPMLNALETPVAIGAHTFAHGLVVDTRVYTPIADLAPAVAGDSGANGMQHMAVVRDFALMP
jgi:endonuclease/exonuclease/phosphatase family metal-dependent hydrolase